MSFLGDHECWRVSGLDLGFLRIRTWWFFVGSGSVGFLRIGIRLVFQDRDSVGFFRVWIYGFLKDLDVLFFGILDCFVC